MDRKAVLRRVSWSGKVGVELDTCQLSGGESFRRRSYGFGVRGEEDRNRLRKKASIRVDHIVLPQGQGVRGLGFVVQDSGFGFRVWGLGFGVWGLGLGFGVWVEGGGLRVEG